MTDAIGLLRGAVVRFFRARRTLLLENLALRQQLATLKRKHPRPKLAAFDKLFWVSSAKVLVGVETGSHCCESRNRCALAPIGIRTLLASHLQKPPDAWQKKDFEGNPRSHI
jgi:hypothetical protein